MARQEKLVVVGLPTLNEASNIARAATAVDVGLTAMRGVTGVIVNADNYSVSPESTHEVFRSLDLQSRSKSIVNQELGKGVNIRSIFSFAQEEGADAVVLLDSDVTSLEPDWVPALAQNILSEEVDASFPLYRRSRFDATATNHLILPTLVGLTGRFVSQPIGGEFAFSGLAVKLFNQHVTDDANGFGIDIFLTSTVLGNGLPFQEVELGEKTHRAGQNKISRLFREVFRSLVTFLPDHIPGPTARPRALHSVRLGLDDLSAERRATFVEHLAAALNSQVAAHEVPLTDTVFEPGQRVDANIWTSLLVRALVVARKNREAADPLANQLLPFFLQRNLDFWEEVQFLKSGEVERKIIEQALIARGEVATQFYLE